VGSSYGPTLPSPSRCVCTVSTKDSLITSS